jgi:ubiquinone/menaquinone biosynthesis C-methylase UbiE
MIDLYVETLLRNFKDFNEKQGSQAFESMFSASQYIPAYNWILENINRNSKVLDWGCGNGHFSHFLNEFGYQVTPYGFDSPLYLSHSRSSAYNSFVKATTNTILPFDDGSFDIVTSIGVLEHVREFGGSEVESLKEITRVLKPGGIFYCFHFPNKYSWIEYLSSKINRWHHQFRYTEKDIYNFCKNANLSVIDCKRYGALPRNIFGYGLTKNLSDSKLICTALQNLDDILEILINPVLQNYTFIGKK